MVNENKVVMAHTQGFTVRYVDSNKQYQYQYEYDRPLLPYIQKIKLLGEKGKYKYRETKYTQYESKSFNPYQRRLYKDAVYGLSSYSLAQIRSMTLREREEIKKIYNQTQEVINVWKQEILNNIFDDLLIHGLPGCEKLMDKIRKVFRVGQPFTSRKETNLLTFAELNLSQVDIAGKLIEKGILPANFFKVAA